MYRLALSLFGFGLCAQVATAADPGSDCVGIDDDRARLACYDRALGRVPPIGAIAPAAAPAAASAPAAALPAQAEQNFGLSASQQRTAEGAPTEIVATVASVQSHSYVGRWIVTLDSGQVWEQRETTPEARRPRVGDKVTIREATFGSYLLTAPGRGSSRVKRIR